MSLPLFRTEALQARRHSWLGEVVLDQPPSARRLAQGAMLAGLGIVLLLAFGDYTRRTRVAGQLVPQLGLSTVTAPVSGTLAQLPVQEGQRLLAGDLLARIVVPGATRAGGDTQASLERALRRRHVGLATGYEAQRRRLQAQAASVGQQEALARTEMAQLERELETRRRQQWLAEQSLAKLRQLHAQRYVTDLQLQQQQTQALDLLAALQALQRQRLVLRQKLAQLRQAQDEVPQELAALQAARQRDQAALAQELTELRARGEALVQAPMTGAVGTLFVHTGQAVQAGQPLLALLPAASRLEAHLAVPGAAIGFIAPGDEVLLRYAAYPYQKFGQHRGRVLRVSRNAFAGGDGGEAMFRVVVALERQDVRAGDRSRPLRPGLALEADILGERRRLWEWVLEPLQTLRGQLAGAGDLSEGRWESGAERRANSTPAAQAHAAAAATIPPRTASLRGGAMPVQAPPGCFPTQDSEPARLAADPGRTGVVAAPATGGLSMKEVPCVN